MTVQTSRMHDALGLVLWVALTFAVAGFASRFEPGVWYDGIAKPDWTPPGWVFGPVWGFLYLSMSVAVWLVWRRRGARGAGLALGAYLAQLACNGLWSWLFFGRYQIGAALVDLAAVVALVALTMTLFFRASKPAGALFVPYLLWVSFACALNFVIWRIN